MVGLRQTRAAGVSGAQALRVTRRSAFVVSSHRFDLIDAEGAVQLLVFLDANAPGRCLTNLFCGADTADQLQAVVDELRGRTWG